MHTTVARRYDDMGSSDRSGCGRHLRDSYRFMQVIYAGFWGTEWRPLRHDSGRHESASWTQCDNGVDHWVHDTRYVACPILENVDLSHLRPSNGYDDVCFVYYFASSRISYKPPFLGLRYEDSRCGVN